MARKIKLIIAYDGTHFCGWQKQKDHLYGPKLPSLQETLELGLQKIFNHPIDLCASGRTDAGVHAYGQVAHFITSQSYLPKDLCWAMNAYLPPSIVIKSSYLAPQQFHATLSARAKTYCYYIWNHERASPFFSRYSWWIRKPLDVNILNKLTQPLLGTHDFKSFQTQGTPVLHTQRHIFKGFWKQLRPSLIVFEITGSGFLKQMVRNIVGTLIEAHRHNQNPQHILDILIAKDRRQAGPTAPPQGLFLKKVYYSKELDNLCIKI